MRFETNVLTVHLCSVHRICKLLVKYCLRAWPFVAFSADLTKVSDRVSEMYRGVSFEVQVIKFFLLRSLRSAQKSLIPNLKHLQV